MNRSESYASLETHTIAMDMVRSTIDVYSYDTENIQLLISGDDESVSLLHLEWLNGKLMLSMPMRDRVPNLIAPAWMQIVLRLPRTWKGAMTLKSQSGNISVNGYTGTDFTFTISGSIGSRFRVRFGWSQRIVAVFAALRSRGVDDGLIEGLAGKNLMAYYDRIDPRPQA